MTLVAGVVAAIALSGCGGDDTGSTSAENTADVGQIPGVVAVPVSSAKHVSGTVDYPTEPPAGGNHNGAWQNCGFYDVPVINEHVVHSLEHGAVWITYRPDVDAATISAIEDLTDRNEFVLASPYSENPAPVVLTVWGRQLALDSASDPRVQPFLDLYLEDGPTTPEPGALCSGAVGVPPGQPTGLVR